jgi:ABC-type multidrug transport system fused ATPase/permease subunit
MGANKSWFSGIIFFMIIFMSVPILAATEDFQYSAPSTIQACACSNFVLSSEIINIGDVHSHYFISDVGTASPWTKTVPEYFNLAKGEQKALTTLVNVPCGIQGEHTLYTLVRTSFGLEKVHIATLDIKKCDVLNVVPVKTERQVCAGDVAVYEFLIQNYGVFNEEMVPSVTDFHKYSQFNFPNYNIDSNDIKPVYLYVASMDKIGTYNFNVSFTALRSGFVYTVPITYTGVDCNPKVIQPVYRGVGIFDSFRGFDFVPLLLWLLGLLLIILILLLILLIIKAILFKRRKDRTLNEWVKDSKDDIHIESVLVKKAKKKSDKVVKTKKSVDKTKLKKVLKWILLILLLLILLGLLTVSVILLSSLLDGSIEPGFFNFSRNVKTDSNITLNVTDPIEEELLPITNVTEPIVDINETIDINETTDINKTTKFPSSFTFANPLIRLFTNYSSACSFSISLLFVLFIFSLFLVTLKPKKSWSERLKLMFKVIKYSLPVIFFVLMIFSLVFCVFNNVPEQTWPGRCTSVRFECSDGIDENLNITELSENDKVIVERKPLISCFCHTIFGSSVPVWLCLIFLILLILLIIFLTWLVLMIPAWYLYLKILREKKKAERKSLLKNKTKEDIKTHDSTFLTKKSADKMVSTKPYDDVLLPYTHKRKSFVGNMIKDIILLLILFLLLFLIGLYFYSYDSLTDSGTNVTEDDLIDYDEVVGPIIEIEDIELDDEVEPEIVLLPGQILDNQDLKCSPTFYDNNNVKVELASFGDYKMLFSWYRDRGNTGNFVQIIHPRESNILTHRLTTGGDYFICETLIENETLALLFNSSLIEIVSSSNDGKDIDYNTLAVEDLAMYIIENGLESSFKYLVLYSGQSKEINLSKYFIDPDGDELFFSVENITSNEVSIDIWKEVALIKAKRNFIGIVEATFIAEDPSGAEVSAMMTIVVRVPEIAREVGFLGKYRDIAVRLSIVLLLILLILFVYYLSLRSERKKKKGKNTSDNDVFKNF